MSKIGRNDPCPCGSGKKYKKCCLPKQKAAAPPPAPAPPPSPAPPGWTDPPSLPPYAEAKLFERSDFFATMRRKRPREAALHWTVGRVAALDETDLLERLRELGIEVSPDRFPAEAADTYSAWEVGRRWIESLDRDLDSVDEDFVCLAACELWKRHCPDRPSVEMLDDWIEQGYDLRSRGDEPAAADLWLRAWDVISSRFTTETTADEAVAVFDGTEHLFDWIQDLAETLLNLGVRDPSYAALGVRLCRTVLDQFRDEDDLFRINFQADLGDFHDRAGNSEEAERVLTDLIERHPDEAAGYVHLAEVLLSRGRRSGDRRDLDRAEDLLAQALEKTANPADFDVELRLADLRREMASRGAGRAGKPEAN